MNCIILNLKVVKYFKSGKIKTTLQKEGEISESATFLETIPPTDNNKNSHENKRFKKCPRI